MTDTIQRRPGGRSAKVRQSVAEATMALIRTGTVEFSVADVADAAGVHRSTVYRRWPTRAALIDEALTLHHAALQIPDSGDFDADIVALVDRVAVYFANPVERALNIALANDADAALSEAVRRHWQPIDDRLRARLQQAITDGHLASTTDIDSFVLMLLGSLLAATLYDPRPLTKARRASLAAALRRSFP